MKIIMFRGELETLGYFSEQLGIYFEALGHQVFLFDFEKEKASAMNLLRFYEKGNTVVLSFNFHGISGEPIFRDENGTYLWDDLEIPFFNIVVDHPFCYHKFIENRPEKYVQIHIDRYHEKYMNRFFGEVTSGGFLPLGGTGLPEISREQRLQAVSNRNIPVVFTGNYVPPSITEKYLQQNGEEYEAFYRAILKEAWVCHEEPLENVIERNIRKEILGVTEEELKQTLPGLFFLDVIIRNKARGNAVRALLDRGIPVCVYGNGWDQLQCKNKGLLSIGGALDSQGCLEEIADAKISLNVMPWFKDGAHDRIFNSMLNGAVCVTDSSIYLDEILKDGKNAIVYDITNPEQMAERVEVLLKEPDRMQEIAKCGERMAASEHSWEVRASQILKIMYEFGGK